ncbi:hypothetical protein [Deinococcus hopiensis]|uniref:Uncharacterized protein n=1 Tax=Deinococcus hopiensis KR-140 TaxID=695939 RepID=A0A1W1VIP1_9DEIO|nr:hypothetical protein [Deinococcus hopiensis]SMB93255.1 hypothetical protein SAMN00790413_01908 [Deinococcus hopiensis KR-140]
MPALTEYLQIAGHTFPWLPPGSAVARETPVASKTQFTLGGARVRTMAPPSGEVIFRVQSPEGYVIPNDIKEALEALWPVGGFGMVETYSRPSVTRTWTNCMFEDEPKFVEYVGRLEGPDGDWLEQYGGVLWTYDLAIAGYPS